MSIGSKTDTYSTLDIVQKEESIITLTTTIKDNFSAVNIDNYLLTTYIEPVYTSNILTSYNIILKGVSIFDKKIDSFFDNIITYDNINNSDFFNMLESNNYNLSDFQPKIAVIKYNDIYIILLSWNMIDNDTGKYDLECKFIRFNINTLSREMIIPNNSEENLIFNNDLLILNGSQSSNSPIIFDIMGNIDEVQSYVPNNFVDYNFVISWKYIDDSNNESIITTLINYTELLNTPELNIQNMNTSITGVDNIQLTKLNVQFNNLYFLLSYTKDQITDIVIMCILNLVIFFIFIVIMI